MGRNPARRLVEQAPELALVRREHRGRGALDRLEAAKAVRVHDGRQVALGEEVADERLPPLAEAGPSASAPRTLGYLEDVLDRPLHRLEQPQLEHRQRLGGRDDGDVAGVCAERGFCGQARGARQPGRAAEDEHRGGRVLVLSLAPSRNEPQDVAGREPVPGLAVLQPDVRDRDRAGSKAAGRDDEADLPPWNVTVCTARTASPAISPVDASTPEGTSTETIGTRDVFIRSMRAAASGRGSPWKPVPKSPSRTRSAPSKSVRLLGVATGLAQQAQRDAPVAAVSRLRRRPRRSAARRETTRARSSAIARPARSISSSTSWPSSAARISSAV
jgi:hypothetical protein